MIRRQTGNLLQANTEALVNAVNCVGVMGAGIALQFKQTFPMMFKDYVAAAKAGRILPGRMHVFELGGVRRFIINFPTKRHWRDASRIEDIETGLVALVATVKRLQIQSIAIPPLGCGHGGLLWGDVRPRIVEAFAPLPDVDVVLFE